MAAVVKERAEGICQLCNKPAPFYNKKGEPYLECHHIVWIARGGADEVYNQADASGFINLFGLPLTVRALMKQGKLK